jgi:hypothetical protein
MAECCKSPPWGTILLQDDVAPGQRVHHATLHVPSQNYKVRLLHVYGPQQSSQNTVLASFYKFLSEQIMEPHQQSYSPNSSTSTLHNLHSWTSKIEPQQPSLDVTEECQLSIMSSPLVLSAPTFVSAQPHYFCQKSTLPTSSS